MTDADTSASAATIAVSTTLPLAIAIPSAARRRASVTNRSNGTRGRSSTRSPSARHRRRYFPRWTVIPTKAGSAVFGAQRRSTVSPGATSTSLPAPPEARGSGRPGSRRPPPSRRRPNRRAAGPASRPALASDGSCRRQASRVRWTWVLPASSVLGAVPAPTAPAYAAREGERFPARPLTPCTCRDQAASRRQVAPIASRAASGRTPCRARPTRRARCRRERAPRRPAATLASSGRASP
jgi:hypothetical protein